jgi:hypothetical protein
MHKVPPAVASVCEAVALVAPVVCPAQAAMAADDGAAVGLAVGATVGEAVGAGEAVDVPLGAAVGAAVGCPPPADTGVVLTPPPEHPATAAANRAIIGTVRRTRERRRFSEPGR